MAEPVIIEAAISGPDSRAYVPRNGKEIAADIEACLQAGAAIVHNHIDDLRIGGEEAAERYAEAWRPLLAARPDALLYPTVTLGDASGDRLTHVPVLAEWGMIRMAAFDPGSTNLGLALPSGLPDANDTIYANSYRAIDRAFAMMREHGVAASIAIYEPGFLRATLAFHEAGKLPAGSLVKLYFGGPYNFLNGRATRNVTFGLPPTLRALEAYLEMLGSSSLPWAVAVPGGDVVDCGMARLALERGGHLRVGLEDYRGEKEPTNEELVKEAAALCAEVGRPVATLSETVDILGLRNPDKTMS